MAVGGEVGDELHVVAEGDDGDAILRPGGVEEGERGLAYEVNPLLDAARHVEQEDEVEGRARGLHVAHGALGPVLDDGEVLRGQPRDGPPVAVGDARLHAREGGARGRPHVEGVRARGERGRAGVLRQGLRVLADEARRDLADGVNQVGVAAADDGARGLGERALAQVCGHFGLVLDAEEHDAARRLKV